MQKAFPFQIPDSALLEILSKIKSLHAQVSTVQEWFYAVMLLLDRQAQVHFGDLVTHSPGRNGCPTGLSVISYQKGEISHHQQFPNKFIAHAYQCCMGKKVPELTEIQIEPCRLDCDLPYCPVVIPLGCCDYHFGVLAAGSYHDKSIVRRNRRLFEILGMELSLFLLVRHMDEMVSQFLFKNEGGTGSQDPLSFESLLTYKFKQLIDKIEPDASGNILGDVITLVEKILIKLALEKTGHRLGHSADLLGINRNTLRKKIQLLGIESKE